MNTEMLTFIATISEIVASAVTMAGIVFIAWQVSDTRRFTKSQLLNELQRDSKEYRHVYRMITGSWKTTEKVASKGEELEEQLQNVFECLGFFERIKMLLDNKVIDLPTADRLFGYRFFLLVNNPNVQRLALYPDGHDFTGVFALHRQWSQHRQRFGEEIAHQETDLSLHNPKQYEEFVESYARRS